jgi:type III secretion system low calcium response chaperone LcrH/SycD
MNFTDFGKSQDPRLIDHVYAMAYHHYENGKYGEAINLFRFLTLFDLQARRNWIGLGASQQMQKEYDEAIKSYTFAALMDDRDPYVFLYIAHCWIAKGEIALGLQALNSVELAVDGQKKYQSLLNQVELLREAWSQTALNTQLKE